MRILERKTIRKDEIIDRLKIRTIKPDLTALRTDLKNGNLINPILVEKLNSGYRAIAGILRLDCYPGVEVPVTIAEFQNDIDRIIASLKENLLRHGLSVVDEAKAYVALRQRGLTSRQISLAIWGNTRASSRVRNYIRLLCKAEPELLYALSCGDVKPATALELIKLNGGRQVDALRQVLIKKLSREAVQQLVREALEEDEAEFKAGGGRGAKFGVFTVNTERHLEVECSFCGKHVSIEDAQLRWLCNECKDFVLEAAKPPLLKAVQLDVKAEAQRLLAAKSSWTYHDAVSLIERELKVDSEQARSVVIQLHDDGKLDLLTCDDCSHYGQSTCPYKATALRQAWACHAFEAKSPFADAFNTKFKSLLERATVILSAEKAWVCNDAVNALVDKMKIDNVTAKAIVEKLDNDKRVKLRVCGDCKHFNGAGCPDKGLVSRNMWACSGFELKAESGAVES